MKKALRTLSVMIISCMLLTVSALADGQPSGWNSAGKVYVVGLSSSLVPTGPESTAGTAASTSVVDGRFTASASSRNGVGSYYAGGASQYFYGVEMTSVSYGAVIEDAGTGYYGSSRGSIPLYDGRGGTSGIVWGDCRNTAISGKVGFLMQGSVSDGIYVEDGASVTAQEAVILYRRGTGSFLFRNAKVRSADGVLVQMAENAGAGQLSVTFENGAYTGGLYNGSAGSALSVTVGKGAMLCGDVALSDGYARSAQPAYNGRAAADVTVAQGGVWVVDHASLVTSLTVEDGATVYAAAAENEDGSVTLLPDGETLDPGVYRCRSTASLPDDAGPADDHTPADETPAPEAAAPDETPLPDKVTLSAHAPAVSSALFRDVTSSAKRALGDTPLSSPAGNSLSAGILAYLSARTAADPTPSILREILRVKTDSFATETLDNGPRILYNPYCCLAA